MSNYTIKLDDLFFHFSGAAFRDGTLVGVPWCKKCNKPAKSFNISFKQETKQLYGVNDQVVDVAVGNTLVILTIACHNGEYCVKVPAAWLTNELDDVAREAIWNRRFKSNVRMLNNPGSRAWS